MFSPGHHVVSSIRQHVLHALDLLAECLLSLRLPTSRSRRRPGPNLFPEGSACGGHTGGHPTSESQVENEVCPGTFAAESVNVDNGIFHLAGICAETDHVDIHACWVEDARSTGNIQQRRHRAPKWLFGRGQPREADVKNGHVEKDRRHGERERMLSKKSQPGVGQMEVAPHPELRSWKCKAKIFPVNPLFEVRCRSQSGAQLCKDIGTEEVRDHHHRLLILAEPQDLDVGLLKAAKLILLHGYAVLSRHRRRHPRHRCPS
mmetsp:Transcript_43008/g.89720  ORF Transcript_43008/g.89720 Transcript_43008/m.89720 type:complete len:261 (-) Transcript_43008:20-802(-)